MTTEKTNTLEIVRQTDDKQAWWCLKNKKVCVLTDNEIYDILHQNEIQRNDFLFDLLLRLSECLLCDSHETLL